MAYVLLLPDKFSCRGWKVKIRDRERVEPPHVTLLFRTSAWRLDLRTGQFLTPPGGSWNDIPAELADHVLANLDEMRTQWDAMYPENPISSTGK